MSLKKKPQQMFLIQQFLTQKLFLLCLISWSMIKLIMKLNFAKILSSNFHTVSKTGSKNLENVL